MKFYHESECKTMEVLRQIEEMVLTLATEWAENKYSVPSEWMEGRVNGAILAWWQVARHILNHEKLVEIEEELCSLIEGKVLFNESITS